MTHSDHLPEWQPDSALKGFDTTVLTVESGGQTLIATLVRAANNPPAAKRAVLYIHGLTDYFYQTHLAAAFRTEGYAFYAIDLHAYGRSLQPDQLPNLCGSISDYYPELTAAIDTIKATGVEQLVINGHSTGALIASLYAHEGEKRHAIDALFLNSPFFDFPTKGLEKMLVKAAAILGKKFPRLAVSRGVPSLYAKTIYQGLKGEWDYNTDWKPPQGFPLYAGWIRAVVAAHKRVQQGLNIQCPILIMHSARSLRTLKWSEEATRADIVLNIEHMRRYGPGLGEQVSIEAVDDALHDLVLSAAPVRRALFVTLFAWLDKTLGEI
ncbi:MAG TPA: alpha/beta hydrolase [Cellvibrionaceae bacterium]